MNYNKKTFVHIFMQKMPNLPEKNFHKLFSAFDPLRSGVLRGSEFVATFALLALQINCHVSFIVKACMRAAYVVSQTSRARPRDDNGDDGGDDGGGGLGDASFTRHQYDRCLKCLCSSESSDNKFSRYLDEKYSTVVPVSSSSLSSSSSHRILLVDMISFVCGHDKFAALISREHTELIGVVNKYIISLNGD